jgi:hypothetical protein
MRTSILLSVAAAFVACLALPRAASAYCIARGCEEDPDFNDTFEGPTECVRDGFCLVSGGTELRWPKSCISYGVQRDGSELDGIDFDTAHAIVSAAFDTWLSADCGDGATPGVGIADKGVIDCRKAEYNQDQGNANVILFRDDDWPYVNSVDALALTTLTYNVRNGEIYDADIEINSFEAQLTVTDSDVYDDFPSIITHEVGHFLGLSHSNVAAATMRPGYISGRSDLRDLDDDDVAGICTLYPPDNEVDENDCDPRHGFSRECAKPLEESCGIGGPGGNPTSAGVLLLLASAGVLRRFRRRQA